METQTSVQKPQAVTTAAKFLWASLAVGLVKTVLDLEVLTGAFHANPLGPGAPVAFMYFMLFFNYAVMALLILKISDGKNWARITSLVLIVGHAFQALPLLIVVFHRSPVGATLSVVQIGLQIYALFLIFTQPGSAWFRRGATT